MNWLAGGSDTRRVTVIAGSAGATTSTTAPCAAAASSTQAIVTMRQCLLSSDHQGGMRSGITSMPLNTFDGSSSRRWQLPQLLNQFIGTRLKWDSRDFRQDLRNEVLRAAALEFPKCPGIGRSEPFDSIPINFKIPTPAADDGEVAVCARICWDNAAAVIVEEEDVPISRFQRRLVIHKNFQIAILPARLDYDDAPQCLWLAFQYAVYGKERVCLDGAWIIYLPQPSWKDGLHSAIHNHIRFLYHLL